MTKLELIYAIREFLHIEQRGVLETYEFDTMRKRSLLILHEAITMYHDKGESHRQYPCELASGDLRP